MRGMALVPDWTKQKEINTATTTGGTLLVCNIFDALMRPTAGVWPPPALVIQLGDGQPKRYPFGDALEAERNGTRMPAARSISGGGSRTRTTRTPTVQS